jgi:hypothetical protein
MPTNLDRRVCALEVEIGAGERTVILTFATGESCQIPHDFFEKLFAEAPPGSMALPIFHNPDWRS